MCIMPNILKKIPITKEGLDELKKELTSLQGAKLPTIIARVKSAREQGDLSENADYQSAREEQNFVEGRIDELVEIIKNAQIVSGSDKKTVQIGSKIKVHLDGKDEVFTLVGAPEANPAKKLISHESPLGLALLDKKIGDKVIVQAPIGELVYLIVEVS